VTQPPTFSGSIVPSQLSSLPLQTSVASGLMAASLSLQSPACVAKPVSLLHRHCVGASGLPKLSLSAST
jgi:hypothetical protein